MSKEKQTLYIYLRVSTSNQEKDGTSLPEQEKLGIQKAKTLGMDYEIHNEGSKSGSLEEISERPVLANLLCMVETGKVKHIYCYNHDRLSRSDSTWWIIKKRFLDYKVTLHTHISTSKMDNPMDELILTFMTGLTKYENTIRTSRLKNGRFIRAKQGYWVLGSLPFGYKLGKNKKLTIDKEQSEWVKRIFKWYSEGMSPMRIKTKLDGNILTNRGKTLWTDGSVNSVLRNTHHGGFYTYLGVKIDCPRIVDQEIWDKVQERLNKNQRIDRGCGTKVYDYPLRQILWCKHCGTQMSGISHKVKKDGHRINYCCSSRNKKYREKGSGDWVRGKYCENNVSMDCHKTEDTVWETLLNILRLSHQERELFKKTIFKQKNKSQKTKEKEITLLNKKIDKTKESISLIEEKIVEKEIEKISSREKAKSIQTMIDKLQLEYDRLSQELVKLENDLVSLENDSLWIDWVNDYQNNLDKLNDLDRKERIKEIMKYIKRIDVTFNSETRNHKLDLKLKIPLIGDKLKWKDQSKKKKGYSIQEGKKETMIELESNVRNIRVKV